MKGTCTQLHAAQTSSNIDLRSIIDILIDVIHPDKHDGEKSPPCLTPIANRYKSVIQHRTAGCTLLMELLRRYIKSR